MRRLLLYTALAVGSVALLLLVPAPFSSIAFVGLLIGLVVYARQQGTAAEREQWRDEFVAPLRALGSLWQRLRSGPGFASQVSAGAALGAMLLSANAFRPGSLNSAGQGLVFALVGGLLLGVALRNAPPLSATESLQASSRAARYHKRALLLGLAALLLVTLINMVNVDTPLLGGLWYATPSLQFILFMSALVLLAWGLGVRLRFSLVTAAPLLLILLLAFVLRLWQLEDSVHRYVDEVHYVNGIIALWDDPTVKLFAPFGQITSFTSVFPYWQMLMVSIFGPSLSSLRLVSVLLGTLNVLALYTLARALFNRQTALLAALLLATFPPHIHFSRLGLNNIADPFWATVAFALAAWGFRTGRRSYWALGGIALGLTQYFYEGGRLLYPPLLLCWLAALVVLFPYGQGAGKRRALLGGMGLLTLWALLLAAPLYLAWIAQGYPLTPRLDLMAAVADLRGVLGELPYRTLSETLRDPFWMLVQLPDSGWFYGGAGGLMSGALLPFFLLGIAWTLWCWRQAGSLLLILWIMAGSLGNSLLRNNTDAARYVVLLPVLPLVAAMGLRQTWVLLVPSVSMAAVGRVVPPFVRTAVFVLLALVLAWGQVAYYFNEHLPAYNIKFGSTISVDDAMFRAVQLPGNTDIYLISGIVIWQNNIYTTLRFFGRQDDLTAQLYTPEEFADSVIQRLPLNRNYAFFVEPGDIETARLLRARFNISVAQVSPFTLPAAQQFLLFYAPARRA